MIITFNTLESFKLQFGDFTIALNPVSKESKFKNTRFGSNIAISSFNHPDFNGFDLVSGKDKNFLIDGPGEYEIGGVFVRGFQSVTKYDQKSGEEVLNTIYTLTLEGMKVGFLGSLSSKDLSEKALANLSDVDILLVPISGEGVLDHIDSYKLAVKLGAKIIIPMHFTDVKKDKALDAFIKESGSDKIEAQDKLTIKPKDLLGKSGDVVILSPQA